MPLHLGQIFHIVGSYEKSSFSVGQTLLQTLTLLREMHSSAWTNLYMQIFRDNN